jgi:hypothetical protein
MNISPNFAQKLAAPGADPGDGLLDVSTAPRSAAEMSCNGSALVPRTLARFAAAIRISPSRRDGEIRIEPVREGGSHRIATACQRERGSMPPKRPRPGSVPARDA